MGSAARGWGVYIGHGGKLMGIEHREREIWGWRSLLTPAHVHALDLGLGVLAESLGISRFGSDKEKLTRGWGF